MRDVTSFAVHLVDVQICLERVWRSAQVRCIAAVLLLVGRGLEAPSVVARLLDVPQLPGKPQYCLAPEVRGPCCARCGIDPRLMLHVSSSMSTHPGCT